MIVRNLPTVSKKILFECQVFLREPQFTQTEPAYASFWEAGDTALGCYRVSDSAGEIDDALGMVHSIAPEVGRAGVRLFHHASEDTPAFAQTRFFSSCMLRPRPRISLVKTSKLAGVPASSVFSPLTMLS